MTDQEFFKHLNNFYEFCLFLFERLFSKYIAEYNIQEDRAIIYFYSSPYELYDYTRKREERVSAIMLMDSEQVLIFHKNEKNAFDLITSKKLEEIGFNKDNSTREILMFLITIMRMLATAKGVAVSF